MHKVDVLQKLSLVTNRDNSFFKTIVLKSQFSSKQ